MDDRTLRLALEALLDEPTLKSAHRASVERGLTDLRAQRLTSDDRADLYYLIEHYAVPAPSADSIAALVAAFQHKLPNHDPAALSTAIHALVAGDAAQLDGKSLALTIERRGQTQIANLAERNVVIGDLNQLDISVQISIPDARFDHLIQSAFQRQTHERITKAAQQIESDRLLNLRLQGFVGRVNELAAIRANIEAMRPTGGYVLIKALAGEGKSSSIAKLIQAAGIAATPHHFIALTTGREYQLGLLRAVVAQLILKHHLTVSYFPEESYPAMKTELARILDDLSKQGIAETIYLDGLDQLQPEIDGSRDLSFLPPQPPPGIVIVLGSRPDETLKPLEILHRVDYDLPPLSEGDALALWRSVQSSVAVGLLYDLYRALKGNALFVHLAANTMQGTSVVDATSLIRKIEQNPQNLFGITLERMKGRSLADWRAIWKPMLALLLVTQEPLRLDVVGDLLGHDHDTMRDAVWVLGGLVSQGIDQRVALHHLLFRDYLVASVFNDREVKRWHHQLANWCAKDLEDIWADHPDSVEQVRRVYARHHYITHLSLAENWPTLWQVLDTGDYGEQKTRFDPSTRLYALDLHRGRESAINAGQSVDEHIQNLPRLWKYSLLRTTLGSKVDQWPTDLFVTLALLGQTQEALARIELLSDPKRQIIVWGEIIRQCDIQQKSIIISQVDHFLDKHSSDIYQREIIAIAKIASFINDRSHAMNILDQSIKISANCKKMLLQVYSLAEIAQSAILLDNIDKSILILDQMLAITDHIIDFWDHAHALGSIARIMALLGDIDKAITLTNNINEEGSRIKALTYIAQTIALSGNIVQSVELLDKSITIVNMIDDDWIYSISLSTIAQTFALIGNIDNAIFLALSIKDIEIRIDALNLIAQNAISIGYMDQARDIVNDVIQMISAVTESGTYIKILTKISHTFISIGDIDQARKIFNDIVITVTTIDDKWSLANILSMMAKVVASNGDIDQAITIATSIDDRNRHQALATIAQAAASRGNIDQAITIATSIDDRNRHQALVTIAQAAASRGNIDQAITIATSIDDRNRHQALVTIAQAAASRGNIDQAITIATSIDDRNRHQALVAIAQAAASRGNIDQAITIAISNLENTSAIADAFSKIAQAAALSDNIDRAIITAAFIFQKKILASTLALIAQTAIALNDISTARMLLSDALTVTKSIDNRRDRNKALITIVQTAVLIDDLNQAITIATSMDDKWLRYIAFSCIAKTIATLGDLNKAITVATSINESIIRHDVFSSIAKTAALLDNIDQAVSIAQFIDNQEIRIPTLVDIFEAMQMKSDRIAVTTIQYEWVSTNTFDETWIALQLLIPLLKTNLCLRTWILEGERWVNAQLKRLG